ncbi:MAG: RNA 2',3'-cyclic phosphodiesterase [Candidatus Nanohaloarchaea archaeon]
MPRVFSAVDIEDTNASEKLEKIRNQVDHGFKPVPKEKMHITLQFFKNVDPAEIDKIKNALQKIEIEPFKAEIKGLGVFPSKDYIRVIWAGVNAEELYQLKEEASRHEVEPSSNNDFRPHITLHRVDDLEPGEKKDIHQKLEEHSDEKIAEFRVNKVKLFESHLDENGSSYEELAVKQLG